MYKLSQTKLLCPKNLSIYYKKSLASLLQEVSCKFLTPYYLHYYFFVNYFLFEIRNLRFVVVISLVKVIIGAECAIIVLYKKLKFLIEVAVWQRGYRLELCKLLVALHLLCNMLWNNQFSYGVTFVVLLKPVEKPDNYLYHVLWNCFQSSE